MAAGAVAAGVPRGSTKADSIHHSIEHRAPEPSITSSPSARAGPTMKTIFVGCAGRATVRGVTANDVSDTKLGALPALQGP